MWFHIKYYFSAKKTFTIVTMKFPIVLMKSIQKLSAANVTKDSTFWVVPVTILMSVIKMIHVAHRWVPRPRAWNNKERHQVGFQILLKLLPLNLHFSKHVQTHQEVIIALVVKRDINSMNGLVSVKILMNVNLAHMTVQVIFDAKILRVVSYANLKRLPLRQLPGV